MIARQVRKELERAGYPLLDGEVAQRVAFPELSMRGIAPSVVDPDGQQRETLAVWRVN